MLLLSPFAKAVRLSQAVCPFLCLFVNDQYTKSCECGNFLVLEIFKSTHLRSRDGRLEQKAKTNSGRGREKEKKDGSNYTVNEYLIQLI